VAIAALASTPMALVVHPALPVKTVKDLIALAKLRPGELNYGSAGPGTGNHMCGELFRYLTKADITHIPYKGAAPALADVVGGQVHIMFSTVPAAVGLLQAGRLRALGVSTAQRYRALPGVPTMIEAGIPGYEVDYWYGFFAPAATPLPVVDRLYDETALQLRNAEMIAGLQARGLDPIHKTRKEFEAFVKRDIERWAPAVKASGAAGF
jgi:tripartite-type tricarboxylate transporter receptor subunit TctC